MTNLQATAKIGMNILLFSVVGGLQVYKPIGDVTSETTGTVTSATTTTTLTNATVTADTPTVRAKWLAGLYLRLPFFRLGGQFDMEFSTGTWALAGTAQFVF